VALQRRRVYILPSGLGVGYAFLVFAMLLGSMNYANSMGFALTFLLTGLGLVAMHHCHRNLEGTEVRFVGAQPVFAGDLAVFRIALLNSDGGQRYELVLTRDDYHSDTTDLAPGETARLELAVPTTQRGLVSLPRFAVTSRYPGNLFRCWSWLHMPSECLVYPQPARAGRPLPVSREDHGDGHRSERGDSNFSGLRGFVPGDSTRRVAWKASARSEELLVKQFSGTQESIRWIDWDHASDPDTEARVSQLTRWCLDLSGAGQSFGLRLPNAVVNIGSGASHLHECLKALALYDDRG
jgi:uncharacterized protein (DUF58 family)